MNLNCETILDFYTHKNRKVFCQIKVHPKSGKFENSCRCLSQEHWKAFDKELEKLIATIDDWGNEKCLKFVIKPYIQVKVKKSKLKFEHFYKCFGTFGGCDIDDIKDANFVLECVFDFQLDVPFSSTELVEHRDYSSDSICGQLPFVPYTSSGSNQEGDSNAVETSGTNCLDYNEDTYSPKLSLDITTVETVLNKTKATCNSSPINANHSSNYIKSSSDIDLQHQAVFGTDYKIESDLKEIDSNKSSNSNLHKVVLFKKQNENEGCAEYKCLKNQEHSVDDETMEEKNLPAANIRKQRSELENVSEEICESRERRNKHRHNKKETNTIYEIPPSLSVDKEKLQPKNRMESIDEISYKKLENRDKISFHKSKKEKHDEKCSLKEVNTHPKKKLKRSLRAKEIKVLYEKKSQKSSKPRHARSDNEFEDDNEFDKNLILQNSNKNVNNLKSVLSSAIESTPPSEKITEIDGKASTSEFAKSLRRSERSPSKPKRFIEELHDLQNVKSSKKHKSSLKNKELFHTDDQDEDNFENNNSRKIRNDDKIKTSVFEMTEDKKIAQCSPLTSSTKNKRKRDKSSSKCEQEKRDINKWLSKKKIMPLDKKATNSSKASAKTSSYKALPLKTSTKIKSRKVDTGSEHRSKSSTPTSLSLELPSKQEMELMRNKTKLIQTENAKVRAELDKMRALSPKEVEILSLQNISVDEILDTFLTYKSALDEIYENNRKKDYIKGHDGINHCFVIRLLQQNTQMQMLEKLTEVYSNSKATIQATLFANALLPEWIMRVYMEKFNFTRQQAIDQIKAQEEFQLHMEDKSDNSFNLD